MMKTNRCFYQNIREKAVGVSFILICIEVTLECGKKFTVDSAGGEKHRY